MPTKRPRINVTITPELHQALVEFRRASGMSSASLISQLLSETVPVINAMTEAYKVAKKSPQQAAQVMRDLVTNTHVQVAQMQLDMQPKAKKKIRRSPEK